MIAKVSSIQTSVRLSVHSNVLTVKIGEQKFKLIQIDPEAPRATWKKYRPVVWINDELFRIKKDTWNLIEAEELCELFALRKGQPVQIYNHKGEPCMPSKRRAA